MFEVQSPSNIPSGEHYSPYQYENKQIKVDITQGEFGCSNAPTVSAFLQTGDFIRVHTHLKITEPKLLKFAELGMQSVCVPT